MPPPISVILCTHNPRKDYLQRALGSLKSQTLPLQEWEFLFIDNASAQCLANDWDISWHPQARHVREDELGLTSARLRGIRESRHELIVFIDDDNVLAPDFLAQALLVRERHAHLGAFGAGQIEPEFEFQPAVELRPQLRLLALRSVATDIWSNNLSDSTCIPWGAGLCVTRAVALAYVQLLQRLNVRAALGRCGQQLLSGEDDLFSWASVGLNQGFGIFPCLQITHLISAPRLNQDYFLRLIRGHTFSHGIINFLLSGTTPKLEKPLRYMVRMPLHALKNGHFSLRCHQAARSGNRQALKFIEEHRLRPLQFDALALAS